MSIDEPFEYLTFGGTFGRTFGLMIDRFDLFMAISTVVFIPFVVLYLTSIIFAASVIIREDEIPDFHPKHLAILIFVFAMQFLLYDVSSVVGQGAVTHAVAQIYIGQRPTWLNCLKKGWKKKWVLVCSSLIVHGSLMLSLIPMLIIISFTAFNPNGFTIALSVITGIAYLCGAIFGYLGVILTSPAIMVEGFTSPIKGIQRSWELATGSRCYLFCTLFCFWFLNQLIVRLLHNMFVSGNIMDAMFSIVGIVMSVVPVLIYFPLHSILETVLYLNLRIGRESMNHQVLSGDLMNDAAPASRFRTDDDPGAPTMSQESMVGDYRHVALMDDEDSIPLQEVKQNPIV